MLENLNAKRIKADSFQVTEATTVNGFTSFLVALSLKNKLSVLYVNEKSRVVILLITKSPVEVIVSRCGKPVNECLCGNEFDV